MIVPRAEASGGDKIAAGNNDKAIYTLVNIL